MLRGAAAGAPVRPPKLPYRSAATRVRDPPPPVARCPAEQRTPACPPGRSGRGRYASARRCGSRPAASRRGPVPWAAAPGGSPGLRQPVVLSEIPHRHLQGNLQRPGCQLARGQHGQRQQRQQRQRHQPGQRHGAQSAAKPGCHLPVARGGLPGAVQALVTPPGRPAKAPPPLAGPLRSRGESPGSPPGSPSRWRRRCPSQSAGPDRDRPPPGPW